MARTLLDRLNDMVKQQKERQKNRQTELNAEPVESSIIELTEEQKQKRYKARVNELIRQKYSVGDELAIMRQQFAKKEEYDEYFAYCEECKARAKAEVYGNEV